MAVVVPAIALDPTVVFTSVVLACASIAFFRLQPDDLVDERADDPEYTRNVAIVVQDGVELLDFAGPGEVFQIAGGIGSDRGRRAFRPFTVGESERMVTSQGFVRIVPAHGWPDVSSVDVLVVPGGDVRPVLDNDGLLGWIGRTSASAELTLSVCTGAFVLGAAGVLDGRPATTWFGRTTRLARRTPGARVLEGERVVDAGSVVTTAGVSAGIDGSLHVVARLLGRRVAERTARYLEYPWSPEPTRSADYAEWNPSTDECGRRVQKAHELLDAGDAASAVESLATTADREPDHALAWILLARARWLSGDEAGALRASDRATRVSYGRRVALYDRACLRCLSGDADGALEDLRDLDAAGMLDTDDVAEDEHLAIVRPRL